MSLQTPKLDPSNQARPAPITPPVYDPKTPLDHLIGVQHSYFSDLDSRLKEKAAIALYHALNQKSHSLDQLTYSEDVFELLCYVARHDVSDPCCLVSAEQVYQTVMRQIPDCSLTSAQKIALAVCIAKREGATHLNQRITLSSSERTQVLQDFSADLDTALVFQQAEIPQDFEQIKRLAHRLFSGPRAVPSSQHHNILMNLLYAKEPDLEAITYVMKKYLTAQRDHFYHHGTHSLLRRVSPLSISYRCSLAAQGGERTMAFLHPGGVESIRTFLEGEADGCGIDDNFPGLLIYQRASVEKPAVIQAAQQIAARNADFPALLKVHVKAKNVYFDPQTGYCRLNPGAEIGEDVTVLPVQPEVKQVSDWTIRSHYSDRPDLAERIITNIQERVAIQNPKDRVRRRLNFGGEESEPSSPPPKVPPPLQKEEEPSPSTWTWGQVAVFALKCFAGLFILKFTLHLMHSIWSPKLSA